MNNSFIRFIFVGFINTIVGLSTIYFLFHSVGFSYWVSTFLGNSVGACVSFVLNRSFTFRSKSNLTSSIAKFIIVILLCYFVSYNFGRNFVEWALRNNLHISSDFKTNLAILLSTGLYTLLNYLCQRIFVFPQRVAEDINTFD
ncbi:MAG: putative rane protein [Bacillales bacterium]|jgi:putative flippase GtrA|nr:putative rane protein [Bacillales bacterium]